jgi:diguanylate cyclase (GGDEF)-like protein/PAS domain S-box-containing protein
MPTRKRLRHSYSILWTEDHLRLVMEGTLDGVWDWDIATGEVRFNEHWATMLGYDPNEIEPNVSAWERLMHPDDRAGAQQALHDHLEGRSEHYTSEHRLRGKSGQWIWILDRGKVVARDDEGRPLRAAGTHVNITARKQAELALSESEARYRGLIESQFDLIVRVDPEGRFTFANDAYCAMFGKSRDSLIGGSFSPLVHPDDLSATLASMRSLLTSPHRIYLEQRAMTAHGWRWLAWEDYAITDALGGIVEIQAIGRDVTQRKLLEEQLLAQRDLAQRVSEAKTPTEVLTVCLDIALRVSQMDCGAIYLAQNGSGNLDLALSRGLSVAALEKARRWPAGSSHTRVAAEGRPVYRTQGPGEVEEHRVLRDEGVRAVAILPIVDQGRSLGCILLGSHTWEEVPELARPPLETVTKQSGAIIRRIQDDDAARAKQAELQRLLHTTNLELNERLGELKQHAYESRLLSEMASMLQVCLRADEAYQVIERHLGLLFPAERGALYILRQEQKELVAVSTWGDWTPATEPFWLDDCWGLRRGHAHLALEDTLDLRCAHLGPAPPDTSLCVPLVAQGETLGVLFVCCDVVDLSQAKQNLAQMVADEIALALSNLSLRDSLRQQSIRDALTGLFNRRFMSESLRHLLARRARTQGVVSLVLLDIDHFKKLNDTFGHDAGDTALREVAAVLQSNVREGDIVCRYGGEEFLLVLPDAGLEAATRQAERICDSIRRLNLTLKKHPIGPLTVSAGVACAPEHGTSSDVLLRAADTALYAAKTGGRDRVCVAGPGTASPLQGTDGEAAAA